MGKKAAARLAKEKPRTGATEAKEYEGGVGALRLSEEGLDPDWEPPTPPLSPETMSKIRAHEQFRAQAYKPTKNDVPTIGYGETKGVKLGDRTNLQKAETRLAERVREFADAVDKAVKVPINEEMRDALTSLTYNIGTGAFKESTLLKKLNEGDYRGAASQFMLWNKQAKKELPGLTKRRSDEYELFMDGVERAKK